MAFVWIPSARLTEKETRASFPLPLSASFSSEQDGESNNPIAAIAEK